MTRSKRSIVGPLLMMLASLIWCFVVTMDIVKEHGEFFAATSGMAMGATLTAAVSMWRWYLKGRH